MCVCVCVFVCVCVCMCVCVCVCVCVLTDKLGEDGQVVCYKTLSKKISV